MQTPLEMDIWLQSYEEFVSAKNNIKHGCVCEYTVPSEIKSNRMMGLQHCFGEVNQAQYVYLER